MRVPVNRIRGKAAVETTEDILADALAKQYPVTRGKTFVYDEGGHKRELNADIVLAKQGLIIEVQEKQDNKAIMAEMARERIARANGFSISRFSEKEVRGDIDNVLHKIGREVQRLSWKK
jgi:hypothetical protein